jgi:hypothetical protein
VTRGGRDGKCWPSGARQRRGAGGHTFLGTPCEVACRAVAMLELWGDAQRDLPLLPPTVFSECLDVRLGVPASLAGSVVAIRANRLAARAAESTQQDGRRPL